MALLFGAPLNGNIRNQGILDINTYNSYGAISADNGKIGKCYLFGQNNSGTPIVCDVPEYFLNNTVKNHDFSISFGVKPQDFDHNHCISITYGTRIGVNSSGNVFWHFLESDGSETITTVNGTIELNKGSHIACAGDRNSKTGKIYIDGELKGELNINHDYCSSGSTAMYIGCDCNGGTEGWLKGALNDVRVYSHCLSPKEVKEISKGLVLHYPLNDSACSKNLASNTDGERTSSNEYMHILGTYQDMGIGEYTFSCEMKVAANTPNVFIYGGDGDYTKKYTYSVSNIKVNGILNGKLSQQGQKIVCKLTFSSSTPDSTAMPHISTYYTYGSGSIVSVRNPKLEKGGNPDPIYTNSSYNVVYDCSGYSNNGTITGSLSCSSDSPRYKISSEFNNVGINTSFTNCGLKEYSYSAGINLSAYHSERSCISIGGTYFTIDTNGHLSGYAYGKSPAGFHSGNAVIPLNTGTHVALVGTPSYLIGYINGNEDFRVACSGTFTNTTVHTIGSENADGSTRKFTGKISDLREYATALSAEDVKELYNTSALITK